MRILSIQPTCSYKLQLDWRKYLASSRSIDIESLHKLQQIHFKMELSRGNSSLVFEAFALSELYLQLIDRVSMPVRNIQKIYIRRKLDTGSETD